MSTILLAAITAFLSTSATLWATQISKAVDRRRDRLALVMANLIAWIEFPYRIRRRTSDKPETLEELADEGHQMQQRFAADEAWIAAHQPKLLADYRSARREIGESVGQAATEAWSMGPVSSALEMNIGDWGPARACHPHLVKFEEAIKKRWWQRFM